MHRFDDKAQTHTLEEIVLLKGRAFPKALPPYSEPEPVFYCRKLKLEIVTVVSVPKITKKDGTLPQHQVQDAPNVEVIVTGVTQLSGVQDAIRATLPNAFALVDTPQIQLNDKDNHRVIDLKDISGA
ncbi:hypothetical protein HDU78_007553 [Chytriomyces hyalinus]|nr:hypothetical protein HDU78_007553 [Chytriomyces hyalinus]